jgi:hypothetical protein
MAVRNTTEMKTSVTVKNAAQIAIAVKGLQDECLPSQVHLFSMTCMVS